MKRRGFTLVELLVSIAVISLLLGLLFPAVQAAREAARASACQSNLHQLGISIESESSIGDVLLKPPAKIWLSLVCPSANDLGLQAHYVEGDFFGLTRPKILEACNAPSHQIITAFEGTNRIHGGLDYCLYLDGHVDAR